MADKSKSDSVTHGCIVLTVHNGVMYWVRVALVSIFSVHSEDFRALEERRIFNFSYTFTAC